MLALGPRGVDGVFQETGALERRPYHPEILVRVGDAENEERAYALAEASAPASAGR